MMALAVVAVVLSYGVLAAHFLRDGNVVMVGVCVFVPFLLFFRHPMAARIVQAGLVLGALEWLWTLAVIVSARMDAGMPYTRTAIILGVVAALTLATAFVFRAAPLRRRYGL